MQYSQDAIGLIKEYEGFRACVYKCPADRNTIGYGHVLSGSNLNHKAINEKQALKLLQSDLTMFGRYINKKVKVTLTQPQYDALCSLVYNWGCTNFAKSKGFRLLNQGKYDLAASEFFSKERGVVNVRGKFCKGLYRRRQAELKLWRGLND